MVAPSRREVCSSWVVWHASVPARNPCWILLGHVSRRLAAAPSSTGADLKDDFYVLYIYVRKLLAFWRRLRV